MILEAGRQEEIRELSFGDTFGVIWPILGAFWSPAGRQGAPKIHHFGTKAPQKSEK